MFLELKGSKVYSNSSKESGRTAPHGLSLTGACGTPRPSARQSLFVRCAAILSPADGVRDNEHRGVAKTVTERVRNRDLGHMVCRRASEYRRLLVPNPPLLVFRVAEFNRKIGS